MHTAPRPATGVAFPASVAGIVGGSLVAAPLVAGLGLSGSLVAAGALAACYAVVVALPRGSRGRHRAARATQPLPEPVSA